MAAKAVLTARTTATGTAGSAPATYNDNGVDGGIPAPNAIVDGGYDIVHAAAQNSAAAGVHSGRSTSATGAAASTSP